MNNRKIIFILLLSPIILFCAACSHKGTAETEEAAIDTIPVLVTRMEQCSRLYTTEYQMRKIVIYDNPAVISGKVLHQDFKINLPIGDRRIAIPVTATAKAYVDMGKLTAKDVRRNGDKIEITLPDPEVTLTATKVDNKGIKQKVALLRSRFSDDEITRIQQQGRKDIIKSLKSTNIIEDARQSAARQLIPVVTDLGFKEENITITFRKEVTPSYIERLIN